ERRNRFRGSHNVASRGGAIMRTKILALGCGALLLAQQACGRDNKQEKVASSADTSMANMPGMQRVPGPGDSAGVALDSNSVALTSAQIAHGKIAWAVPATSTMSGTVEVPGQLVVN